MQSALRSATRRAVAGISSRRGVASTTTTTTKAATTSASEDWLAVHEREKAWVKAMVQREVRAQMAEEEERRIMRDRLRAAAEAEEERRITRERLRAAVEESIWCDFTLAALKGCAMGAGLSLLMFGRVF